MKDFTPMQTTKIVLMIVALGLGFYYVTKDSEKPVFGNGTICYNAFIGVGYMLGEEEQKKYADKLNNNFDKYYCGREGGKVFVNFYIEKQGSRTFFDE